VCAVHVLVHLAEIDDHQRCLHGKKFQQSHLLRIKAVFSRVKDSQNTHQILVCLHWNCGERMDTVFRQIPDQGRELIIILDVGAKNRGALAGNASGQAFSGDGGQPILPGSGVCLVDSLGCETL